MKTKLLLLLFCLSFQLQAQITFEDTLSFSTYSGLIRLQYAGDKYFFIKDTTSIELYNLNHTLYKSISIPNTTIYGGGIYSFIPSFISETLFDNDSSTIEYLLGVMERPSGIDYRAHMHIYDENGNSLFFLDSCWYNSVGNSELYAYVDKPVFNTDTGTKMILRRTLPPSNIGTGPKLIFSLPGTLYIPCDCFTSSGVPLLVEENYLRDCPLKTYPNPSSDKTTIEYKLPEGIHEAELKILSMYGAEIKSFRITDRYKTIELNNEDIPSGNYYYQVVLPNGRRIANKLIVVH
jgi:hypothetical protein